MTQSKQPESHALRVVIDTNVLVSMLVWRGKSLEFLYMLLQQRLITPCLTPATLVELRRVLQYDHIAASLRKNGISAPTVIGTLLTYAKLYPAPTHVPQVIHDDPTDNMFLACAIVANAAYIISGDQHLLKLKEIEGINIVKPAVFIRRVVS